MLDIKTQNVKFLKEHPSFCVLAFAHLRVDIINYEAWDEPGVSKISSLCCSVPKPVQVNRDTSLNTLMNHRKFKQDREMFYANKIPVQCESICSLKSKNQTKREVINKMEIDNILYEKVYKQPEVKIIDYNFGNECNLSCRMCFAGSSNQIGILTSKSDNIEKLIEFGIVERENVKNDWLLRKGTLSDKEAIKEVLPNLSELLLVGGEPFVSKEVDDILHTAIENGDNEHINLVVTTNGTKFIEEKLDIFLKFRKIDFIVSIDGYRNTYDYIRYPFTFTLIEKRCRDIVEYIIKNNLKEKINFHFVCMGLLYNLYDYQKLYNFLCDIFGELNENMIPMEIITGVYGGGDRTHALSWDNVPYELLNDALLSYKDRPVGQEEVNWYRTFKEYVTNRKPTILKKITNRNPQDAKADGMTLAKEHTLLLDELHERQYSDHLHPKLIKYIDSIK